MQQEESAKLLKGVVGHVDNVDMVDMVYLCFQNSFEWKPN